MKTITLSPYPPAFHDDENPLDESINEIIEMISDARSSAEQARRHSYSLPIDTGRLTGLLTKAINDLIEAEIEASTLSPDD